MTLPEGRKPLTDDDMVILLHNMARQLESYAGNATDMRTIADRLSELSKQSKARKLYDTQS